jgi:hypothetical protein
VIATLSSFPMSSLLVVSDEVSSPIDTLALIEMVAWLTWFQVSPSTDM